ncbi:Cupin domain-containing protein [Haloplanus vescus]|uniref:Cupin domain-containing protein n=1 Tax=Haloplanus vescus TaxID=555874 RepID=A0A1H3X229_9EURY|nr:cupin domain-containing protein [Haloplanus vescus]SDZ93300.1 Cupin domain-containing protein [Haloplanus vescus]
MDIRSSEDETAVEAVPDVFLSQLASGDEMSVQQFVIDPGAAVPEHSHPHEQAGFVTQGEGVFVIDGEERVVSAGDSYVVPGGESHRVENRGDVPFEGVDIFSPPRDDPAWRD